MTPKTKAPTKTIKIVSKFYDGAGNLAAISVNYQKDTFEITPFEYLQLIAQGFKFKD